MSDLDQASIGEFRLGDWLVQPSLNRISRGDTRITLELKVMQVLVCLAEHGGDLVTRQQLTDTVWATEFISDNTVTHAITELRNALGDDAKSPTFVETIHRRGYRLVAPVEWVGGNDEDTVQRPAGKPRWPHILAIGIAAVIGLLVILPPEALFERRGEGTTDEPLPRIVVLPFENLGPPEDEYFADGVTEEIISRLAAVSGLQVISRTSAMYYKGKHLPIRQIGEELEVGYVLEGTIRWDRSEEGHGRVRINPQLIKVADDSHLWSDRYDRTIESVFEVQSDIAGKVVEQLHVTLLRSEVEAISVRPTDSPEAYEAFLYGLHYSVDENDLKDVQLALSMFERAVDLDPDFADAWANISKQLSWLYFVGFDRSPECREASKHAAERALEINPFLAEGHWALGLDYYQCHRDYERALVALNQALAIRPGFTGAMVYVAAIFRRQGRWTEAIEMLNRAFTLDPKEPKTAKDLSATYHAIRDFRQSDRFIELLISLAPLNATGYFFKSIHLFYRGRYQEGRLVLDSAPSKDPVLEQYKMDFDLAERRFEAALTRTLETPQSVYTRAWGDKGDGAYALDLCRCYYFLGDRQEVQTWCGRARDRFLDMAREYPRSEDMSGSWTIHTSLGLAYAYLGLKDEAIKEAEGFVALLPVSDDALDGPSRVLIMAQIYALVNEPDTAIDRLSYLLSIPGRLTVGHLRHHPDWDPLRDHPRFQALLEKYDTEK